MKTYYDRYVGVTCVQCEVVMDFFDISAVGEKEWRALQETLRSWRAEGVFRRRTRSLPTLLRFIKMGELASVARTVAEDTYPQDGVWRTLWLATSCRLQDDFSRSEFGKVVPKSREG